MGRQVKNIYFNIYPFSFERTGKKEIHTIFVKLSAFREAILKRIEELFPREEAIFL
jgi:hypothetical protein